MPFIGSAGPKFFLKESMEEVAAIKDIGNYFDRAEYIKWKSFRETDDSRYIGLVMPRVLGRLPYGPDTVPVRSFNYVEEVKGRITINICGPTRRSLLPPTWCAASSTTAGACKFAARRLAARCRICLFICMIWGPVIRLKFLLK